MQREPARSRLFHAYGYYSRRSPQSVWGDAPDGLRLRLRCPLNPSESVLTQPLNASVSRSWAAPP